MDSTLPSRPHDDSDKKPSFRKPSNETATRKYRRHSPIDGSDSSLSGGSPRCERSPVYSTEDRAKTHSDRQRRDEKRVLESDSGCNKSSRGGDSQRHSERQTSNNSHDSRRYDDHNRHSRPADEEDKGYHRSSRPDRDLRSGTHSDYTRRDSNYERSRESWRNVGKYTRDRSENVGHRSNDKERDILISDHHKHNEKDSDRAAHGSKPVNSSRHDVRTGDRDRHRDREAHDERSDRHRSPGDQNNDESRSRLKELVVKRDSGTAHSKDAHETSNKELDGMKNDQLQKRKHTSKESDEHKKYTRELGASESKSSTFHDKERRKELVPENQNSSDKKLKLVQEEGEKPFSSSKQVEMAGKFTIQPSSSATNQVDAAQNLDAAKVKAMQAAESVNKNLVGGGYMSTDQKKKLLWGSKKSTTTEESSKRWDLHSFADRERQEKFNKLMGVKGDVNLEQKPGEQDGSLRAEQQEQLKIDLEKQYTAGLRRRDGRTVGLGL